MAGGFDGAVPVTDTCSYNLRYGNLTFACMSGCCGVLRVRQICLHEIYFTPHASCAF